jgi:protein-S-isoprenylcysteine O-methyltransferase Ste14
MPLSEDDQRRLDEIERALQRDDPKFAAGHSLERLRQRRLVAAGAVVLIGMVLLVVGLAVTQAALLVGVIISVAGFLFMVGGAAVLIRRHR